MAHLSKRVKAQLEKVQAAGAVDLAAAVKLLKSLETSLPAKIKPCKFDQTVTLNVRLGVDPKQADQIVRGSIVLPHGIGKSQRVLVFCQGDNVAVAQAAGADHVG